jgi:uncharacterized protein
MDKAMPDQNPPTRTNGKICYIEMPAIEPEHSATFYQNAFGWNIRKRGDGKTAFDDTVGQISGVWVAGRKASPEAGLLVYIMVDDISAAIEKVIANAGKIVQAVGMDAPELTARFSDPAGNILGLYQEPPKKNK